MILWSYCTTTQFVNPFNKSINRLSTQRKKENICDNNTRHKFVWQIRKTRWMADLHCKNNKMLVVCCSEIPWITKRGALRRLPPPLPKMQILVVKWKLEETRGSCSTTTMNAPLGNDSFFCNGGDIFCCERREADPRLVTCNLSKVHLCFLLLETFPAKPNSSPKCYLHCGKLISLITLNSFITL